MLVPAQPWLVPNQAPASSWWIALTSCLLSQRMCHYTTRSQGQNRRRNTVGLRYTSEVKVEVARIPFQTEPITHRDEWLEISVNDETKLFLWCMEHCSEQYYLYVCQHNRTSPISFVVSGSMIQREKKTKNISVKLKISLQYDVFICILGNILLALLLSYMRRSIQFYKSSWYGRHIICQHLRFNSETLLMLSLVYQPLKASDRYK